MTFTKIVTLIGLLNTLMSCSSVKQGRDLAQTNEETTERELAVQRRIEWINASSGGFR
jgi:hypothetical protein